MVGRSPDSVRLRRHILAFYRAWESLDMGDLARFYSKSPEVVIFNDVGPASHRGWKEFRKAEAEIMAKVSHWKVTPRNLKVSVWGRAALSTATPLLTGESKAGKKYDFTIRHTAAWRRKSDTWLIVHDHWSIPYPSP